MPFRGAFFPFLAAADGAALSSFTSVLGSFFLTSSATLFLLESGLRPAYTDQILFFFFTTASHRLSRALAGAGVRFGSLAPNGQPFSMAAATESSNVDEALDIHADLAAQVTLSLDVLVVNGVLNPADLIVLEVLHPDAGIHSRLGQDFFGQGKPHPEQISQSRFNSFFFRQINSCDASHTFSSIIPGVVYASG